MKKANLFIIFFFVFSPLAGAQESPKVVTVQEGQIAPFAGTLLNPAAVAHTIAEKENLTSQCKLTTEYTEQREKAKCDLLVNTASARLDASQTVLDTILAIKDEEIKRLNEIALDQPNKYNHWWFAGGVVTGIVTSVVIFYASVQVAK